jgi:membrane-associated phospholipid phosphatase
MRAYYERLLSPVGAGLLVLALLVVAGWWSARHQPQHMAAVVWAALAALVAFGVGEVLVKVQVLAQRPPYTVIKGAEVLVTPLPGYSFPSPRAALAGAVVFGLLVARRWRLSGLAALAALLLLFAGVYVGVDYPSDVGAGAALGAVVAVLLWPLGSWLLAPVVAHISSSPFGRLVVARGSDRPSARLEPDRPARLPDAKVMEALRAASEAARHATSAAPPAPPSAIRTKIPGEPRGDIAEDGPTTNQ